MSTNRKTCMMVSLLKTFGRLKVAGLQKNVDIALAVKVGAMLSVTLVIYWRDFLVLVSEAFHNELTTHILLIPFFTCYIIYRKRRLLRAVVSLQKTRTENSLVSNEEILGLLLFFLAVFVYWHGSYTFYTLEHHFLSLVIFVVGCILILFNFETLKALAFPIALLLFLVPPPLEAAYRFGATLVVLAYKTVHNLVSALGLPINLTIENQSLILYTVRERAPLTIVIDLACAGIHSLIGFAVFAPLAAYLIRGTKLKKLALIALGFPLVYALNIVRITLVVFIAYFFGEGLAVGVFHAVGGWLLVFIGTLGILLLTQRMPKPKGSIETNRKTVQCQHGSTILPDRQSFCVDCGRLLKPLNIRASKRSMFKVTALVIAATLIVSFEVPVLFSTEKGLPEVVLHAPSGEGSAQFLPAISDYECEFVNREKYFERYWQLDAYLNYQYVPNNNSTLVEPRRIDTRVEISDRPPHGWECVFTWPVDILDIRDVPLSGNPPLIGRFIAFQFTGYDLTQIVLYWRQRIPVESGSVTSQKFAKVSLIVFTDKPEDVGRIEDALFPIGQAILNYWRPIGKTWTKVVMSIARYGRLWISTTIGFLVVISSSQVYKKQKKRRFNSKKFNRLELKEEKCFLRAVHQADKKGKVTGDSIANIYQKIAHRKMEKEKLHEMLRYSEEADLVKAEIANEEDQPLLVWKTNISFPQKTKLHKYTYYLEKLRLVFHTCY